MRQEILTTKDYFRCSELVLISVLAYFGFQPEAFDKDSKSPERITGIFKRTEELNSTCENFWKGNLVVEPARFWQIVREIKGRMRTEIHD